jgi:replicative DNA helicase
MMNLHDILDRLDNVKRTGKGYTAKCPAHEDGHNSFGITTGDDDRILVKCFAGCEFEDIVRSMNLQASDFMGDNQPFYRNEEKQTVYKVQTKRGTVEHVRIPKPGGKDYRYKLNGKSGLDGMKVSELPLYEPQHNGQNSKSIFICEGEKAAIAAAKLGCRAYGTMCGAGQCPDKEHFEFCKGQDVVLWRDQDNLGLDHMEKVKAQLEGIAKSVTIIATGAEKHDAANFTGNIEDLKKIVGIARSESSRTVLIHESALAAEQILANYCRNYTSDRIPTGITKIDYALRGGLMGGALYLLGAPSGHGKTTLLQNIAVHCARSRGPVLFVSPEMSSVEIAEREIIRQSGVSVNRIAPYRASNERLSSLLKMGEARERIEAEKLPIHVIDDTEITMPVINEIANGIPDLRMVIVDYAQEIAARTTQMARYLAVGEVGRESIILSKRLSVPVLVASQVNVVNGGDGREYTFRETKDLENRAHCSMILEVTRSNFPNSYGYFDIEKTRIFSRKNRSGAMFSVDVDYDPSIFSIKDKFKTEGYQNEIFDKSY